MEKTKKISSALLILSAALFLVYCGNGTKSGEILPHDNTLETIKFTPETAVEARFDELFESSDIIDLQQNSESAFLSLNSISATDSLIIIPQSGGYLVFGKNGDFRNRVGEVGEGPDAIISPMFYYADDKSIMSICGTKWIRYGINGSVLEKGRLPYTVYPRSFLPLNDSTWLFYVPFFNFQKFDKLRLWTTDQKFNIKEKYLFSASELPFGESGLSKYIYETGNGIYIADRVVDTIYRFTEEKAEPVYLFDYGDYKYRKQLSEDTLGYNEADGIYTVVTSNTVLHGIRMNNQQYLLHYNRKTGTAKTISKITGGPDPIEIGRILGTDKYDRIYWTLNFGVDSIFDKSILKQRYADLLKNKMELRKEQQHYIYITTIK